MCAKNVKNEIIIVFPLHKYFLYGLNLITYYFFKKSFTKEILY